MNIFWYWSFFLFSEQSISVVWWLLSILEISKSLFFSNIFVLQPPPLLFQLCTFWNYPSVIRRFVLCFFFFLKIFSLNFNLGGFYWPNSNLLMFVYSAVFSLLMSPLKIFFTSVTVLFIYNIFFWLFLTVSFSQLILPIYPFNRSFNTLFYISCLKILPSLKT